MKSAFRKASKKWHPDKGGNLSTMTLLNSLWQKYQGAVVELRNTQVCAAWVTDLWDVSCSFFYGPNKFKELVYKTPQCLNIGPTTCKCLCCVLNTQHALLKLQLCKKCLFWGECYCLRCFTIWFGLPTEHSTFELWAQVMAQMPRALLQLEATVKSKYYFHIHIKFILILY